MKCTLKSKRPRTLRRIRCESLSIGFLSSEVLCRRPAVVRHREWFYCAECDPWQGLSDKAHERACKIGIRWLVLSTSHRENHRYLNRQTS